MNICGILVHVHPERYEIVKQRLLAVPGVEIHGVSEEGRTVVTLEDEDEEQLAVSMLEIQRTNGVLAASMIYHHRED
jgi:nitrate reductase NapD